MATFDAAINEATMISTRDGVLTVSETDEGYAVERRNQGRVMTFANLAAVRAYLASEGLLDFEWTTDDAA